MNRTVWVLRRALLASILMATLSSLPGCPLYLGDGGVSLEGWVVPNEGPESRIEFTKEMVSHPKTVLKEAHVQIRSRQEDEDSRDFVIQEHGRFSFFQIVAPYPIKLYYRVVVTAEGYQTLKQDIVLVSPHPKYCLVRLARLQESDGP